MRLSLLSLLLAALLANAAFGEDRIIPDTYRWVVERGIATGCVREKRAASLLPPGCQEIGVLDFACSTVAATTFIRDFAECRKQLPVKTAWFKSASFMDCVATVEAPGEAKASFGILEHLPPAECDHNTISPDEACEVRAGSNLAFHPNSKMSVEDLVPEILNLAQGEVVPKEVYVKYDARKIGMTITRKIYQEVEAEKSEKVLKADIDYLNGSALQMAFHHENIDSIVANGFLNQHQNRMSNGTLAPSFRAQAEDTFLGYKLEKEYQENFHNPANKVRPKYAYFGLKDVSLTNHPMYKSDMSMLATNYGNVFAVFSPEVKDRATFTRTDSLGLPKEEIHTSKYQSGDADDKIKKAGIYLEAQIWGDLTIKDVKHFIVNCSGFKPIPAEAIEKLKAIGKPIYACQVDRKQFGAYGAMSGGMGGMGGIAFGFGMATSGTDTSTSTATAMGASPYSPPAPPFTGLPIRVREGGVLYNDPRHAGAMESKP